MNQNYSFLVRARDANAIARLDGALADVLGFSAAELSAKPLSEWVHPDDRAAIEECESGDTAVARHVTKSGDWVAFKWQFEVRDGALHALGQLSSQDYAPDELKAGVAQQHDSMDEMLTAMALIVEAKNPGMRCSILLVDPETQLVNGGVGPSLPPEYNAAVEGLRIGPLVGSCGTAAFWNIPVVVSDIHNDPLWRDLRDAARLANVSACWSQPIRRRNGEVLGAMALYDDSPRVPERYQMDGLAIAARMVGLAIDRMELEAQVRQTGKMEALGVLAGGVAHDFNNMLSVILGNADLARTDLPQDNPAREMLDDIVTASRSAAELCTQLLAYSGRSTMSAEIVDCNCTIRELSKLLSISLSKKAQLHFELRGCFGVRADPGQLRQVLMNLITNAAEAVGNTEGEVLVTTRELTLTEQQITEQALPPDLIPGEYAEIVVRDTGCGMSKDTRQKLFDPFYSTKDEGRGLGLAAVKGIVDAHDWVLRVDSEPGKGSTFRLLVPRIPVPADTNRATAQPDMPTVACVLAVDDEPGVLNVATKILQTAGMEVLQAKDGREAIDIYQDNAEKIDCVLLDLNMPRLDGEEVFTELKRINDDVRVLLTSGFAEQEVLNRFHGGGVRGALQKPFGRQALLNKVLDALH